MSSSDPSPFTTALVKLTESSDSAAIDALLPFVYEELRALARRQRRRDRASETLTTTALVHEAYLKLVGSTQLNVTGRAHFFALAARAMRQVLSNYARAARAGKRGSGRAPVSIDRVAEVLGDGDSFDDAATLVALDDALASLARRSERQSRVVECRFYAGMSIPETALALGLSEATVKRDWAVAQAWLYRELRSA